MDENWESLHNLFTVFGFISSDVFVLFLFYFLLP